MGANMSELIYKDECFRLIGACMEVHGELGEGHSENIYLIWKRVVLSIRGIEQIDLQKFSRKLA